MIDTIIFFGHYAILLAYGIVLSLAFGKISFNKKNLPALVVLFVFCGLLQIVTYILSQDTLLWEMYPLLSHLPLILVLWKYYKRRFVTALAATTTAYLCCQPANIAGEIAFYLTRDVSAEYLVRIVIYLGFGFILFKYFRSFVAEIFTRNDRSIYTFAFLPLSYYIYDYLAGIYTDFWYTSNAIAREILPFFIFCIFITICVTYYREYALREYSEQKEQLILTTAKQQKRELESLKRSEQEIHLIRHDMRHVLQNVAVCIENDNSSKALELISSLSTHIDNTVIHRYCENESFNYIISTFVHKCELNHIDFSYNVEVGKINLDEIMLSSILSNALDNAFNAQLELSEDQRSIKLLFKQTNGKLLLSVKNPFYTRPVFVDGLPFTKRVGHGYGTKSIQYTTEKLGGNCQFSVQDDMFVLRIVL